MKKKILIGTTTWAALLSIPLGAQTNPSTSSQPKPTPTSPPQPTKSTPTKPQSKWQKPKKNIGPMATFVGFTMLPEGGSRLFVDFTGPIVVIPITTAGQLVYTIPTAYVDTRNNLNPLDTSYYNAPFTKARLKASKTELSLVIDMRANVKATHQIQSEPGGSTKLIIDFPEGKYVPENTEPPQAPPKQRPQESKTLPAPSLPPQPTQTSSPPPVKTGPPAP